MVTKAGIGGEGAGGWGERSGYKRTTKESCGDEDALYLGQYPPVTLHYSSLCKASPPSRREKGHEGPSAGGFLTTVGDSSDLKIEGLPRQDSGQQSG